MFFRSNIWKQSEKILIRSKIIVILVTEGIFLLITTSRCMGPPATRGRCQCVAISRMISNGPMYNCLEYQICFQKCINITELSYWAIKTSRVTTTNHVARIGEAKWGKCLHVRGTTKWKYLTYTNSIIFDISFWPSKSRNVVFVATKSLPTFVVFPTQISFSLRRSASTNIAWETIP